MRYYFYKTTNLVNGKYYLGVHASHNKKRDSYLGSGVLLKKAVKKYGKENFKSEILKEFSSSEEMYEYEKQVIDASVLQDPMSYNCQLGGLGGTRGMVTVARNGKEIKIVPEQLELYEMRGWKRGRAFPMSEETKQKIGKANSIALKGKVQSEETRRKRAIAMVGKPHISEEGKERLRQNRLGKVMSEESKQKIRDTKAANGTLYISRREDVRAKNSAKHKSKPSNTKGKVWIYRDEERKVVLPELVPSYLEQGWVKGRK